MGSDDLHKREKQDRKARTSKEIELRSETWLIVCEGTKTEPNYFKALMEYVKVKTGKNVKCKIEGTGRNTESLIDAVDNFIFVEELEGKPLIPYGKVFTVFDKDSFKAGQFNNAIHMSERKGYITIWSNECIELWFLLHFQYFQSDIPREEYFDKLSEIHKIKYEKSADHFNMLDTENNLQTAMKYAKKLYDKYDVNERKNPSIMVPCTMIFRLIEEIEEYIGEEFR